MALTEGYKLHAAPQAITAAIDREYLILDRTQDVIQELQELLAVRLEQIENGLWPTKKEANDGSE